MAKAKSDVVRAKVLWPNVWTSKGKVLKGAVVELSPDEFALLDARDAVKRV